MGLLDGPRGRTEEPVKILSTALPIVGRFSGGCSILHEGVLQEGGPAVWVNISVAGPRIGPGGRADRSSVNRSISQADPQGISSVPFGSRCHCAPVFPRLPFIAFHGREKGNISVGAKKPARFLLNFDRIALELLSFFARADQRRGKSRRKSVPRRR